MKVPEMASNISAYQAIKKSDAFVDYSSAFHAFLHINPNVVSRAVLAERKGYHDQDHEKGSIVSSPSENPSDWNIMYHPLYGNCITYSRSNFSGAVKFFKMVIDLNEAYPPRPPKASTTTAPTTTNSSFEEEFKEPETLGMEVGFAPLLSTPNEVLPYGLIDRQQTNRRYENGFGQFMVPNISTI